MGIIKYPNIYDYWNRELRIPQIADSMSLDRFIFILRHLHFRNNDGVSENDKRTDRCWKMRLWFDLIIENFSKTQPLQYLSVDEQMIPYKG